MSSSKIFKRKLLSIAVLGVCGLTQNAVAAEPAEQKIILAPLVITATRVEQNSFDLPVAIDVVEKKDIQDGQLQMTLSESLIRVPGITAQNRNNQSQDPQISSRGFGSRSSFGVRGVRVYVDGIPLTMPDGQGQPGVVDLSAVKSIEVMRGPFSALYGSSSGGVIQMLSEDAPKTAEVGATVMLGSDNTKREIMNATGTSENIEYLLNVSNFETDGYREHGAGKKQQATAKFKINISEATKLTALVNWFDQEAQDPSGLARANPGEPSAFTNPRGVAKVTTDANARVYRSHRQVGFNLEHALSENNTINVMSYAGTRENSQYLSLKPGGTNNNANSRASDISRDFWGTDVRWDNKGDLFSRPYNISLGLTYGKMNDARMDINADNGIKRSITVLNNTNYALNRDEANISTNFDQYIQGKWSVLDSVDLHAGARRTKVKLEVKDKFITGTSANGDTSGSVEYQKTTPVVGIVWKVNPALNLYANYGKGFETPTFIEVAYSSLAGLGPNFNLKPSTSNNYELGLKAFVLDNTRVNVTVFKTNSENEIVAISGAPYAVYTNAGKTERQGLELSADAALAHNFNLYAAYTYLDAKFTSSFIGSSPTPVASGNHIPGTYRSQLYGEVSWKAPSLGFSTAFEGRYNSKVYVDDINTAGETAPAYTIFNLRAGFKQNVENWSFSEYARIENLFDKDYIGSVRVNDTNKRFYEPAAGRNYLIGLNANYRFN